MINFYRDIRRKRSELLVPLTRLTSKGVKFKWTDVEQNAFDEINCDAQLSSKAEINK